VGPIAVAQKSGKRFRVPGPRRDTRADRRENVEAKSQRRGQVNLVASQAASLVGRRAPERIIG